MGIDKHKEIEQRKDVERWAEDIVTAVEALRNFRPRKLPDGPKDADRAKSLLKVFLALSVDDSIKSAKRHAAEQLSQQCTSLTRRHGVAEVAFDLITQIESEIAACIATLDSTEAFAMGIIKFSDFTSSTTLKMMSQQTTEETPVLIGLVDSLPATHPARSLLGCDVCKNSGKMPLNEKALCNFCVGRGNHFYRWGNRPYLCLAASVVPRPFYSVLGTKGLTLLMRAVQKRDEHEQRDRERQERENDLKAQRERDEKPENQIRLLKKKIEDIETKQKQELVGPSAS